MQVIIIIIKLIGLFPEEQFHGQVRLPSLLLYLPDMREAVLWNRHVWLAVDLGHCCFIYDMNAGRNTGMNCEMYRSILSAQF